MIKIKRILSFMLLATMLASTMLAAVSCGGGNEPETEPELIKTTTGFSNFEITYYWGPHNNQALDETFWQKIAEAGFTSVPIENNTVANNKTILGIMKKHGLTCSALYDSRVKSLISIGNNLSQEAIEAKVQAIVDDYKDFDNIVGWWLYDEPGTDKFEVFGKIVAAFKKIDPNREVFIDLFPTYAKPKDQLLADDYYDYVDQYLETVNPGYLCYDHYHFKENGKHSKEFFENFEIIRDRGLAAKIDYMSIVQLTKFSEKSANLTRSQILWEANMCLTYGAKRISYFTFILDPELIADGWDNACMSYTGEIYPHYYDVQAVNARIYPLGNELFNKLSVGVYHLLSDTSLLQEECEVYEGFGKLGAVEGDGFVIGFFNDESFMITNAKYEEGDAGKNTLTFIDVTEGLEYFDVESATWKAYTAKNANGNYVFEAMGGEGVLFRVK